MLGRSAEDAVVIPVFDGELKLRLVKPLGKVTEACRKARPEPGPSVAKLLQRSACSQSCRIWKRRRGLEKSKPKGHVFGMLPVSPCGLVRSRNGQGWRWPQVHTGPCKLMLIEFAIYAGGQATALMHCEDKKIPMQASLASEMLCCVCCELPMLYLHPAPAMFQIVGFNFQSVVGLV